MKGQKNVIKDIFFTLQINSVSKFAKNYANLSPSTLYDTLDKVDLQYSNIGTLIKISDGIKKYCREKKIKTILIPYKNRFRNVDPADFTALDLFVEEKQIVIDSEELCQKIIAGNNLAKILEHINEDSKSIYENLVELDFLDNFFDHIDDINNPYIDPAFLIEEDGVKKFIFQGELYIDTPDDRSGYLPFAMGMAEEGNKYQILNTNYFYKDYEPLEY